MLKEGLEASYLKALERVDERALRSAVRSYLKQGRTRAEKPEQRSFRDGLTGLLFRHRLEAEYERISRSHQVISLLMLDIDLFSLINDRLGPEAGDGVLQVVSSVIGLAVRENDACFRYGGDEFLILLAGTGSSGALRFAERLRKTVNRRAVEVLSLPLTVSLGVAECPRHSYSLEDLIRMADLASLQAKLDGRNRTVIYESMLAAGTALPVAPGLSSPVSNLPQQSTPFVGRQRELEEISEALTKEDRRLLTLVGAEGIGKTRLALEAASRASDDHPHGAYFVPLSRLTTAGQLASGIAGSLAISIYADGDAGTQLLDHLRDKKLLITLDGFESMVSGGSPLLARILREAPKVRILATSRTPLGIESETVMEIGGLGPDAAELFRHGSRRAFPGLTFTREEEPLIESLCGMLEGIPLGVELAAAWMRSLPLSEAAAGFRDEHDSGAGGKALRSALEFSFGMLKAEEQGAFKKISLFPGSFSQGAVEEVAETGPTVISALLERSLLRRGLSGRYEMHGVVSSFGLDRLSEDAPELKRTRDLLSNHYLRSMQDCEMDYQQSNRLEALEALEEEVGNIREAWNIALEDRRLEEINRSISGLYLFYETKGWLEEAEMMLERLVDLLRASAGEARPHRRIEKEALGKALTRLGSIAVKTGRFEDAEDLLGEGLRLLRELNLREEIAFNLLHSGRLSESTGDPTWAAGLSRESLDIFRKVGDRQGMAYALANLASNSQDAPEESMKLYRDSLAIFTELEDLKGISSTSRGLGRAFLRLGEPEEARYRFEESLSIDRQLGDGRGVSADLLGLGAVSESSGDLRAARDLFGKSVEASRDAGFRAGVAEGLMRMGTASLLLEDHAASLAFFREALRAAMDAGSPQLALETMARMGELLAEKGEKVRALEIAGCVSSCEGCGTEALGRAERLRDGLAQELAAQSVKKALARGRKESWRAMGSSLLATES